jgi:hypothetical protein
MKAVEALDQRQDAGSLDRRAQQAERGVEGTMQIVRCQSQPVREGTRQDFDR